MAQELQIKSYYQSLRDSNFIDTNLCCKLGMEYFLSNLLFKGDLSRVIYSKDDVVFRRRLELLGTGTVKDNVYNYSTLDLPFATFSQTGTFEEDDRGATQNASQIVLGEWIPSEGIVVKQAAVKVGYSATAFFSRRDDVNIASQLLYWEKTPKFPLYYIIEHELLGVPIDIPVFMTLDKIDSNVDYNEKDWLEKSRIFPVKMDFTIRSYQTLIEDIDGRIKLPLRFSGMYAYNDEEVVFTQKTSLVWGVEKFGDSLDLVKEDEKKLYIKPTVTVKEGGLTVYDYHSDVTEQHFDNHNQFIKFVNDGKFLMDTDVTVRNQIIKDSIAGYFSVERDVVLDELYVDNVTQNTAKIKWKIKPADEPHFARLVILVPNKCRMEITDLSTTEYEFVDLYPASKYECTVITYSKNNSKLTYKLNIETEGPKALGKLSDNLVGKTFTM